MMLEAFEQFAKLAPAFLVPVTALGVLITAAGVLVSLYVGISTLREVRKGRQQSIQPFCLFAIGGQKIPVEFADSYGIPGIDPSHASRLTKERPRGKNRVDAKNHWGMLHNYGLGPSIDTQISWIPYRIFIGEDVFVIDEAKRTQYPYDEKYNSIHATPSHLAVGQEATFARLPTPIVVDYKRRISRLDCVVKIEYEDLYANKYLKFQGLRVFTHHLDDPSDPFLLFTFLEEMNPAAPDFSIFGPPNSPVTNIPGFSRVYNVTPDEIGAP
jgi:hypothetical protein